MKVAFIEIGGCGGCALSFMRASSQLPDGWELVYHPLQLDVDELPEDIDLCIIGGAVCAQDQERIELLSHLRKKSKIIVAFGSCAAVGGVMRFFVRGGQEPKPWQSTHQPLGEFEQCDLSVVGCPPPPQSIGRLIKNLSNDKFNPFKRMSTIKRLHCYDLLDDIINTKLCMGCGLCEVSCPSLAIQMVDGIPEFIVEKCIRCGVCYARCPQVTKKWKKEEEENARSSV